MAHFDTSHTESINNFNISLSQPFADHVIAALRQTLERDEAHAAVFVSKIGPDDVVEDMCFYCLDCGRESCESFRARR